MNTLYRFGAAAVLLLVISFTTVQAQDNTGRDKFKSVMVIPFDPDMYFSDADHELAKYNQKSIPEVRKQFRYGLNSSMNAQVLSMYNSRSILLDTAKGAPDDLYQIYQGISYFEDESNPLLSPDEEAEANSDNKKGGFKLFKKNKGQEKEAQHSDDAYKRDHGGRKYINVKIHNVEMLEYLHNKYGTEIFLFVNQFNLVTNYEKCLDRATNTFEREIMIHFSIFDKTGRQLAGDVAYIKFPSNTNNLNKIIAENFPKLSNYVTGNLPPTRKMKDKGEEESDDDWLDDSDAKVTD